MKPASKFFAVAALTLVACVPIYAAALININTASQDELDGLKGIGPTYAARIVEYRTAHGPFRAIDEVQEVKGIGPARFAAIKDFITVGAVPPAEPAVKSSQPQVQPPKPSSVVVPAAQAQTAAAGESVPADAAVNDTAQSGPQFPLVASVVGLAGLIGLGVLGAYLVRKPKENTAAEEETSFSAEEFDIE